MHNAAFAQLGINAHYEALDVPQGELAEVLATLREAEVYGANVSIPHKRAVMPLLDHLTEEARAIGAVNTIVNHNGELVGYNTDAAGFLQALKDVAFEPRGQNAVMLGAGGAARAVAYALLTAGVKQLAIYNRTTERARALADHFAELGEVTPLSDDGLLGAVKEADLLVNTTSVGMEQAGHDPNLSPLLTGNLPEAGLVCDIVYRPAKTRLLREAEAAGLRVQNGLPMLVYQGAEAFRLWTEQDAPTQVMMRVARASL